MWHLSNLQWQAQSVWRVSLAQRVVKSIVTIKCIAFDNDKSNLGQVYYGAIFAAQN